MLFLQSNLTEPLACIRDFHLQFVHEAIHAHSLGIICWLHPQANFQDSKLQ